MTEPPTEGLGAAALQQAHGLGPGAPVQPHVEVSTLRACLAAITRRLQRFLTPPEGIWWLIAFLKRRNVLAGDVDQQAEDEPGDGLPGVADEQVGPRRRHGHMVARLDPRNNPRRRRNPPPAAAPAPASPPAPAPPHLQLQVINGVEVTAEVQNRYAEYCRRSATRPISSVICHMCVFDRQKADHCTVKCSNIALHCKDNHTNMGLQCREAGCCVRVEKEEMAQHVRYCHELPGDWWKSR